ncbi:MAG: hypothetical protein C4520_05510 [Candidatus Abyssobacteria bacterium SURF_5]|uniref:Cytochrome c-552/DMSO reductase-like haem-binding domain-containing protein n=1 Tax=Abyssobacteria bacterium (strain SURF_5) TaxID=2093360 RepID=A0A3A4NYG0_ABYX5|nr:MAG: hypothetical protein C4520_05510 [Candidatus Abyssubacteria bacterium SURF_5]
MNQKLIIALLLFFVPLSFFGCPQGAKGKQPPVAGVNAFFVDGQLQDLSPNSPLWQQAPEAIVDLLPQDLTEPKLMNGLPRISVKALCNNDQVAFRIDWEDATNDEVDEAQRFSDAVAVQLPVAAGAEAPDSTMGAMGRPVHIHLWKASYQRALQDGEWSLKSIFPNATVDHYPSDAAPDEQKEELNRLFTAGLAAQNPLAGKRTSSVDDLTAESFGTLAYLPAQASQGAGLWEKGRWHVVLSRPLAVPEWSGQGGFKKGDKAFIAFAVWDGSQGHAGSRKMRSAWVPLRLGVGA